MPEPSLLSGSTHLLVVLEHVDRMVACRVLDLKAADLPWLAKELGFRTVAEHPNTAGHRWQLAVGLEEVSGEFRLNLESRSEEPSPRQLTQTAIPIRHLSWLAEMMAGQVGLEASDLDDCRLLFQVIDPEHALLSSVQQGAEQDDFVLKKAETRPLRLPDDSDQYPWGPLRTVLHEVPRSRLRCALTEGLWRRFAAAAASEEQVERGYGAPMSAHLAEGTWQLVVHEPLVEVTDVSGPASLVTRGRQLRKLHTRFGGRFAYLHLHPRTLDGRAMTTQASGADAQVARNLDAITPLPVCMPIALSGDADKTVAGEVSAYSFIDGLFQEIPLEIVGDPS